jgi:hypothetical protein
MKVLSPLEQKIIVLSIVGNDGQLLGPRLSVQELHLGYAQQSTQTRTKVSHPCVVKLLTARY